MKKLLLFLFAAALTTVVRSQHPVTTAWITPNPVDNAAVIAFEQPVEERITVVVKDLTGKIIYAMQTDAGAEAVSRIHMNLEELARGIYILQVSASGGKVKTLKFQKN